MTLNILMLAKSIIKQWIQYKENRKLAITHIFWYDQGLQLEVTTLSIFCSPIPGVRMEEFCNQLINILYEHGEHLSKKKEYTINHNHGIIQDQAFNLFGLFFK